MAGFFSSFSSLVNLRGKKSKETKKIWGRKSNVNRHISNLHGEGIFKKQNCYQLLTKIGVWPSLEKRDLSSFALSHKWSVGVPICHCSATEFNASQAHSELQGHIMLLEGGKWSIWQWQFSLKKYLPMLNDTDSYSRLRSVNVAFDMPTDQTQILLLQVSSWTILTKAYGDSLPAPLLFFFFKDRGGEGEMIFFDLWWGRKKKDCSVQAFG